MHRNLQCSSETKRHLEANAFYYYFIAGSNVIFPLPFSLLTATDKDKRQGAHCNVMHSSFILACSITPRLSAPKFFLVSFRVLFV